jgi:hypothetical protein
VLLPELVGYLRGEPWSVRSGVGTAAHVLALIVIWRELDGRHETEP